MRDEQEPTVKENAGSCHDETVYTHPAYGQISVSRVQGGNTTLYGSSFRHNNYVVVRIGESQLHRNLGRDWYYCNREFVEVAMSEAQWATFVSSFNLGSGVPCTIERREARMIPGIPFRDEKNEFKKEGKKAIQDASDVLVKCVDQLIAGPLAGMAKKKQQEVLGLVQEAQRKISDHLPFIQHQFNEHVESRMEQAKVEIHGWMNETMHRAGVAALTSNAPLALEGPKEEENE